MPFNRDSLARYFSDGQLLILEWFALFVALLVPIVEAGP